MERLLPAAIIVAVLMVLLALMLLGWRRRARSQAELPRPAAPPASLGEPLWRGDGLYVATTRGGDQLDRITVHGLGFRARCAIAVHPEGIVLSLRGNDDVFVPGGSLRAAGRATWAIDRVVEPGGLVVLDWMLDELPVDSYLRLSPESSRAMLDATTTVLTPATPEGSPE
ncbi:MAG: hypothetical protein RJQ01_08765 [Microcella sp.]|uniref:PH-like domain-containing protein n=1 Tax=Microcella sp. TaxID=1913979 RepID=UPI0033154442